MWNEEQARIDEEEQWSITEWDQEEFNRFLVRKKTVGFLDTPMPTADGERCWYINWRNALAAEGSAIVALRILNFMKHYDLKPRCLYGITHYAAVTLAPLVTGQLLPLDESTRNELAQSSVIHRFKSYVDGDAVTLSREPIGNTVILEEISGDGEREIREAEKLLAKRQSGVQLTGIIGLINFSERNPDGRIIEQLLAERRITYFSMSDLPTLLRMAYEHAEAFGRKPSADIARAVEQDLIRYGIEVKLL